MATPSSSTGSTAPSPESVSIIIPAFNEAGRLPASLRATTQFLNRHFPRHELIVVDDGSTDDTSAVAAAAGVRAIRLAPHTGKGAAVRAGMLAATGAIVLFTDADLSTPLEEIHPALALLHDGADVVIGSRNLPGSRVERHQHAIREVMGKTFNLFVRGLSGLPYPDTQCGFKCYRQAAAREIYRRAKTNGFAFDVETLIIARALGLHLRELPVRWINSPASKVQIWRHPLAMLLELVVIRRRLARGDYR